MTRRTRILVVDDSAFARKVLREVLSTEADFEIVGFARDGIDALEKIAELAPDVITLDLVMPHLDGAGVLAALQGRPNAPRAVVVSIADENSAIGVAALANGAFDVVRKTSAIASDRLYELRADLVTTVRAAAAASPQTVRATRRSPIACPAERKHADIVVIGASTGGPQAVALLLSSLPREFPAPIALVLHMPVGYTAAYAERIDRESALRVLEAREGLKLTPGVVAIAQAGIHLKVARVGNDAVARLDSSPTDTPHRPSVDVLFASAAAAFGERVLGVVLTGMGADGAEGSKRLHERGARIIVEAESSCVVYGMPRAVAEAGLADAHLPIDEMAAAICARI
jgi:two-component system, chemotaxis family, protein-glutamate methylesterase/glutaminase